MIERNNILKNGPEDLQEILIQETKAILAIIQGIIEAETHLNGKNILSMIGIEDIQIEKTTVMIALMTKESVKINI